MASRLVLALAAVTLLPLAARAESPAAGLQKTPASGIPQEISSGFYADINMGAFFTVGGKNSSGQSRPSNAQAYLQLGVGYDLTKNFSLGANFGLGASASSCFGEVTAAGKCVGIDEANKETQLADNFTATMFNLSAAYKHYFNERFSLQPQLLAGYAMLDPEPRRTTSGAPVNGGLLVGASVGVEYATQMEHFSIGADASGRLIVGPNIFAIAIFPKIKYTF